MSTMQHTDVLIIGAGGVAHVAAHKAAMYNHILGDICIASRTVEKCQQIIDSIHRKGSLRDTQQQLYARPLDASCVDNIIQLIQDTQSQIVINVASAFVNMNVLEACIATGTTYLDTAIHEQPDSQVRPPITGHGFGLDAFDLKDRNSLKQPAECLTCTDFHFH